MSNVIPDSEPLITAQQAGELAGGLSEFYFRDRAKGRSQPTVPSYRFGNRLRFKKSDILAYIEAHLKPAPKE